jgi:hypothetical protein
MPTERAPRTEINDNPRVLSYASGRRLGRAHLDDEQRDPELRPSLAAQGAWAQTFAEYLASRVDLLSPPICLELASIADDLAARAVMSYASAGAPAGVRIDPVPLQSRGLRRLYRGIDAAGTPLLVIRVSDGPQIVEGGSRAFERLCRSIRWHTGVRPSDGVADFQSWAGRSLDLEEEIRQLDSLCAAALPRSSTPRVRRDLSTPMMLVLEMQNGAVAENVVPTVAASSGSRALRERLGRDLTEYVLHRALSGLPFPVDVSLSCVFVQADGRLDFVAGPYAALPMASRRNIDVYLGGVSADDPDRAWSALVEELIPGPLADPDMCLQRFRQAAPLAAIDGVGVVASRSEQMFTGWGILREHGYRPQPHLVPFFQSVFTLSRALGRLEIADSSFASGIDGARASVAFGRARDAVSGAEAEATLSSWLTLMVEMPRKMDDVLAAIATQHDSTMSARSRPSPDAHPNLWIVVAAGVAVMLAILVRRQAGWFDAAAMSLVIGVIGGLLLDVATRS